MKTVKTRERLNVMFEAAGKIRNEHQAIAENIVNYVGLELWLSYEGKRYLLISGGERAYEYVGGIPVGLASVLDPHVSAERVRNCWLNVDLDFLTAYLHVENVSGGSSCTEVPIGKLADFVTL